MSTVRGQQDSLTNKFSWESVENIEISIVDGQEK